MRHYLTKIVALKRREAELVGFQQSPYDALLDTFEPYATTEEIATALGDLKNFLAPFLVKIKNSKAKVSRDVDRGRFRHREAKSVLRAGREDRSAMISTPGGWTSARTPSAPVFIRWTRASPRATAAPNSCNRSAA